MKPMKQEQWNILEMIQKGSISAEDGYTRLLELKREQARDREELRVIPLELSLAAHPSSANHILFDQKVMTIDGLVELVYGVFSRERNISRISLTNLVALEPLSEPVGSHCIKKLMVEYRGSNGSFLVRDADGVPPKVYLKGNISDSINEPVPFCSYPVLAEGNWEHLADELIYSIDVNAHIGGFYRNLFDFSFSGNRVAFRIFPQGKGSLTLDPTLLNSVILGGIKLAQQRYPQQDGFYIPVELDRLDMEREAVNDSQLIVRRPLQGFLELSHAEGDYLTFDAAIIRDNGEMVLRCPCLRLKRISSAQPVTVGATAVPADIDNDDREIAIIGMSGRFPEAEDCEQFWKLLSEGRSGIKEVPKNRWNIDDLYSGNPGEYRKTYCRSGGFLSDIDQFDARFFQMTDKEAEVTDPQQRLFLEACWEAMEEAGYANDAVSRSACGVFVGVGQSDYQDRMKSEEVQVGPQSFWGNDSSVLASRISYFLNLKGPSIAINTACSSSLVSIHLACQSILSGECNMALAGGVFIGTTPNFFIVSSNAQMLSPDGACYAFDHRANGFVPGEGAGVIVLKSLNQAIKDKDPIIGVINASALNQDGKTNGITAPSSLSQSELEEKLYRQADINPESITYVEAHGTGTPLGDPIEFEALSRTFRKYTSKEQFCALGSVKANIGHAATAAGIASMIKVLLAMKHKQIPPCITFEQENPNIRLKESPFYINKELIPWPSANDGKLRAAVSSFGFSGTNCHIVVSESPRALRRKARDNRPYIIPLSARTSDALIAQMIRLSRRIMDGNDLELSNAAYTLGCRRKHYSIRTAFIVRSLTDFVEQLQAAITDLTAHNERMIQGAVLSGNSGPTGLLSEIADCKDKTGKWYFERLQEVMRRYKEGADLEWDHLYRDEDVKCITLPAYAFQKRRYWLDIPENKMLSSHIADVVHQEDEESCGNQTVFYTKKWVISPLENVANDSKEPLIIVTDRAKGNVIPASRVQVITVSPSDWQDGCQQLGERVASIVQGLDQVQLERVKLVIHLDAQIQRNWNDEAGYEEQLAQSFYLLFQIARSLLQVKATAVDIVFIFQSAKGMTQPFFAALEGLAKAIVLEQPRFAVRIVEHQETVDAAYDWDTLFCMELNDLVLSRGSAYVRYVSGERRISSLFEVQLPAVNAQPATLRTGGTYLITGGTQGIGQALAIYLAQAYHARLILMGRSPINREIEALLNRLHQTGGDARYIQADVTVSAEVQSVAGGLKTSGMWIDGIFHCAGSISNDLMKDKRKEQIEHVIGPKVVGTIHLLKYLQPITNDFIMLFSSIASLFGGKGQTDYAYANSFMDHLSLMSRMKRPYLLSANWFHWLNGGMHPEPELLRYMQRDFGVQPVTTEQGTAAIERWLQSDYANLLILSGEPSTIRRAVKSSIPSLPKQTERNLKGLDYALANRDTKTYSSELVVLLRRIISQETGIPAEDLDGQSEFESLGMDSLMITNVTARLVKVFPGLPKTVFFEVFTLDDLALYLNDRYASECRDLFDNIAASSSEVEKLTESIENEHEPDGEAAANQRRDIAVIGMSGIYPKAPDLEAFWDRLREGTDCIEKTPPGRWDNQRDTVPGYGGYLSEYDHFDPLFFRISPKEAEWMDPQERLFIQEVWHTLEDSGYTRETLQGKRVGVFVGVTNGHYQLHETEIAGELVSPLNSYASIANRISYLLHLDGPSLAVDTMCSSFLTALHLASESLKRGECDLAIAGSANLILHPYKQVQLSLSKFASPKGRCHSFGKSADGYVPGEGVGAVLLKPVAAAEADADYIYGVIRATSINHGGRSNGYTVPNPKGQTAVIMDALDQAGVSPEEIGYLEAHGAGTPLGDPVEIQGLTRAFGMFTEKKQYCAIGSVKSNIGHLEAAAGMAGLTKVLLQMKYKLLVPSLHTDEINPDIEFSQTPFILQRSIAPWPAVTKKLANGTIIERPRLAGISAFGAGGSNGHVIVEEHHNDHLKVFDGSAGGSELFVFSAMDAPSLRRTVKRFYDFVELRGSAAVSQVDDTTIDRVRPDVYRILEELVHVPQELLGDEHNLGDYIVDYFDWTRLFQKLSELGYPPLRPESGLEGETIGGLIRKLGDSVKPECYHKVVPYRLCDMAYTLQVGREPLKERLALVVHSPSDLCSKLQIWLSQSEATIHPEIYSTFANVATVIPSEREEQHSSNNALHQAARSWVSRQLVNWSTLVPTQPVYRLPLPGYDFHPERYWVKTPAKPCLMSERHQLHPLVGHNVSTFDRTLFSTAFDGHEFFLNDHVLLNQKVLPGMAYLEAARYAASQATGEPVLCIRNMMWSRVFKLEAAPLTMVTELSRNGKGIGCEFSSVDDQNQRSVHGSCRIITGTMKAPSPVSLELLHARMDGYLEGIDMYKYYQAGGLNYGPAFKMVQSVRYNANEALASLKLPASLESSFNLYGFHPALLDAAFQGGICIQSEQELSSPNTHIPFFLEEAIMYAPLERECCAHITLTPRANSNEGGNSGIRKLNCQLLSTTGNILIELKGFTARAAQLEQSASQLTNEEKPVILASEERAVPAIRYYIPAWEPNSINDNFTPRDQADLIVIFDLNGKRFRNMIKKAAPAKVVLVKQGEGFQQIGESAYTIRFDQSSDYARLLRDLVDHGQFPTHIIMGCSASDRETTLEEMFLHHDIRETLHAELNYSAIAVFHLLKAWKEVLDKKEVTLLACESLTDGLDRVLSSTIRGFAHSLQIHMPSIRIKTVQLPVRMIEKQPERLLCELFEASESTRVKLLPDTNNRYEQRFKPIGLTDHEGSLIRMGGNYLITGGMGGIGKIITRYLVQTYHANVVLLGRSALNEEHRAFVDELQSNECKVVYCACDLTREVELKHAQQQWNLEIGSIDGVIHAAGIMSQKDFLHKSAEDMIPIIDPKLTGTIVLDRVTEREPLRFFLAFSSTSSILGDYGRCDYSAANNVLDEYTVYREERRRQGLVSGVSYVINWPIWEDGGMHLGSREAESQMLQALGMQYLTTTDALKVLEGVLNQECSHVAVFAGNDGSIQRWLSPSDAGEEITAELQGSAKPVFQDVTKSPDRNAFQDIEERIKGMVANMVQVNTERLDVTEKLDAYGFNSVTITELSSLINEEFDLELNPTIFFEYSTIRSLARYIGLLIEPEIAQMQEAGVSADFANEIAAEIAVEYAPGIYLIDKQDIRTKEALRLYLLQCSHWYQDANYRLPEKLSTIEPEEVAAPQSSKTFLHLLVEVRKRKVEIMSIGKGPQLLIIPGFGISGMSLIHQLADLSKRYQLLVIHLPGSGFSEGMKDLLNPPTAARTIIEVLDAIAIKVPIHAMGFSFGGLIAQELIKQYPARFRTLTLGCSFTRTDSADTSEQSLEEKFKADFGNMRNADQYYKLYLASKCVNKSAFEYLPNASLTSYTSIPEINSIDIPVLVISGRFDAVVNCHESDIIAEHIPKAVHVRFLRGGHCANITNPSSFNRLVKLFLQHEGLVASSKWIALTESHPVELLKDYAIKESVVIGGSDR